MNKIRLVRWFVLHVGFAAVPMLASFAAYRYFVSSGQPSALDAGDFLFFTFMISSIACGEVLELIYRYRVKRFRVWLLFGSLLGGALYSVLVYAMGTVTKIQRSVAGFDERALEDSQLLAIAFFVLGTVAIFSHYAVENRMENKWQQRSHPSPL